jgi:peptide/nickel transport system substrate-binding protein
MQERAEEYSGVGRVFSPAMRLGARGPHWLAGAVVAGVLCLAAAAAIAPAGAATPSTLHGAAYGLPDYLDPQLSYTQEGWTAMYDTYIPLLTYRHASGRAGSDIIPGLAKSMPKITDGGRTYTLFLRRGLRYSDGTAVRASDFESTVERLFDLNSGGSPFYAVIAGAKRYRQTRKGGIRGIATNDRSGKIVIHLVRPRSTFRDLLALPFAAPVPPSTPPWEQTLHPPPATGPYAIVGVEPGIGWSCERNPAWLAANGALLPDLPDGHVDRIEIRVIANGRKQVRRVERGGVDWLLGEPPAAQLGELQGRYGGTQFRAQTTLSTYYFWMNTTRQPFNDVRVRRAVNFAVDPAALRRIYDGEVAPIEQILPPDMPGYRKLSLYPHSMAKARRLMAAADPADRDITVWTDTEPGNRRAGAYYRSQLQKLGFRVHLKALSPFDYYLRIGSSKTPNLDTGWANWFADFAHPADFFDPLLSGSSILPSYNGNFARFDIPALNARMAALDDVPLGPAQERQYAALDRNVMKRAPLVPFGTRTWPTFVSKAVDLDKVVWNPLFGTDLASLRFNAEQIRQLRR